MDLIDYDSGNSNDYNSALIFNLTKNPRYIVKPVVTHSMAGSFNPYDIDSYVERHVGIMVFLRGSPVEHYGFSVRLREETWT